VSRAARVVNLVAFQVCWIAFVAGAGRGYPWVGFVPLVLFAAWQLKVSPVRRADLDLMALAAVLGFAVDTSFVKVGALSYAAPFPSAELAPVWIVGMWIAFSLTLNHAFDFLKHNTLAAIVLGLFGGPIAYGVAAGRFGAVTFEGTAWFGIALIGLAWGAVTPLLARIAAHLVARASEPRHA